jgi:hypothetical protein
LASPAILKLEILADASKAQGALKSVGGTAQTTGSKLGGMAKAAAGAFLATGAVQFGKASVSAALESQKAMANLEQGYKSMGETTGDAAKETAAYASELSKKIGVDDDAIIASQAMLVTFSNVSSEAARGAGVMDRATAAAADLAAKGFGSMDSNAVLLGKALQDPAKGLTKLAKNGVTFTDAQKDSVLAMQASGDMLGAQKIILGEVEKQVKGTAEATATSQDKMAVAFGETQEAVGSALLPVLEKLAPILEKVAGFVEDNVSWLVPLVAGIGGLVLAIKAWNVVQGILNVLLNLNPIGAVVLAVAALIAVVIAVVKNWDKITAAFKATFAWVKQNWPLLLAILTGPIGLAVLAIVKNWDTIKAAIAGVFTWIKDTASSVWRFVTDKFRAIKDGIVDAFAGLADILKRPINAVIDTLNGFKVPKITIGGEDPLGAFGPSVPRVTIGGWSLPHIPRLEQGGTVLRTGYALVHAGEQFSGVGKSYGSSTVINVNVTAAGLGADAPEIQRAVVRALRGHVSRNGPLDVAVRT